jgi:hypothetical protein
MAFDSFLKYPLRKNYPFRNSFLDQTCYIFGNGASLKNMDFSNFTNYPTIGINHLVLHKDFYLLDTCCYAFPEPFSFYYYYKNPYNKKYQANLINNLFRQEIAKFPDLNLFTSLSNIFSRPMKNTFFLYHFGERNPDSESLNLCSKFSYMSGGLYTGIGLAIELGFKKAILVGCDYLMMPKTYGHFYSQPKQGIDDGANPFEQLLNDCSSKILLEAISDYPADCRIPCIDYETYTGSSMKYRENTDIVSKENLLILNKAYEIGQYNSPILPD